MRKTNAYLVSSVAEYSDTEVEGPLRLSETLVQYCDEPCEHMKLYCPEQESGYAMPRWGIGWDALCWIGHRRFSRHWSVPQIRNKLNPTDELFTAGVVQEV